MTGPHDGDWLASVRAHRPGGDAPATAACLDDDMVAALAEGALAAEPHTAALEHLAACQRCRRAVASVARVLADPEVAREVQVVAAGGRARTRWWGHAALALTAAAAVLLLAWPPRVPAPASPHRAAPITAAPAPQAVQPVGAVAEARRFRWTPVAGADRYRVTLFDATGAVRYETESTGTAVSLPDSVVATPGAPYWWKVDARVGFDRWVGSELIEFSVQPGPGR